MAKKSEIKLTREGKTASYSNYEDNAEKVINIYKNLDDANEDLFKKSSWRNGAEKSAPFLLTGFFRFHRNIKPQHI